MSRDDEARPGGSTPPVPGEPDGDLAVLADAMGKLPVSRDPYAILLGTARPSDRTAVAMTFAVFASGEGLRYLAMLARTDIVTYTLALGRLRAYGPRRVDWLEGRVQSIAAAEADRAGSTETLADQLGDMAPEGSESLRVPSGYRLDMQGTWHVNLPPALEERVAGAPVALIGEEQDIDTGYVKSRVGWIGRAGDWETASVPRAVIADPTRVTSLASSGAPWSALESKAIVRYLSSFERANAGSLPCRRVTGRMGWYSRDGLATFILPGGRSIGARPELHVMPPEGLDAPLRGWATRGSFDEWSRVAREVLVHAPLAYLGVYAALAAPLCFIVRAPCFTIDWSGLTSGGKTTTLRLAASCWGDASDGAGVVQSWGDTGTHVERYAGFLHSLPVILDDSKTFRMRMDESITSMIYLFSQGKGRGRASKDGGLIDTPTWSTILLSSGEAPLASTSRSGGAWARVLHVRGRPLGNVEKWGRDAVVFTGSVLSRHHGHAGPRLVEWLVAHRDDWPRLGDVYRARAAETAVRFPGRITGRLAGYLAVLDVARMLAESVLGLPPAVDDAIEVVVSEMLSQASREDLPYEAYETVMGWASANADRFWPRSDKPPAGGWVGRWDRDGEVVWFLPSALRRALHGSGFRYEEVEEAWAVRKLMVDGGRNGLHRVDLGGDPAACIGIAVARTITV